ncbi:hypothetical protein CRE_14399 [Caenorhabditis remanei]|uniref:Uncharacterized protein n=1 Tax=Caenorhabditis remanei TaxID=31234 RepID=E3NPW8_CAERE|nr:hypothetical protein CRE_14399 [Caenorhabditis remanei]
MRLDAAAMSVVIQQMTDRGVPADDYMTMWTIAAKLPEDLRKSLARFSVKMGDSLTHEMVLDRISRDIETLAMEQIYTSQVNHHPLNELPTSYASVNFANANSNSSSVPPNTAQNRTSQTQNTHNSLAYIPSQHPTEYIDPITKAKLEGYYAPGPKGVHLKVIPRSFPYTKEEDTKCRACDGKHNEIRCALSSAEFRSQCKQRNICPNCARKHDITKCRSQYRCGYCDGLHHMGGCPLKEHYRNKKNYPAEAKPIETFFRSNNFNKSK